MSARSAPSPTAFPVGTRLPAGASYVDRVRHYEIVGTTARDLWREILTKGPMSNGRRFAGRTDWSVHWTYGVAARTGACRPVDVRVAATITVVLPSYVPADSTSALARDWAVYVEALEAHERRHRDLLVAGLGEIRRAIRDVQVTHCSTLAAEINRKAQAELARIRARNEAYDRETDHGASEGVRWQSRIAPDPTPAAPPPR